MLLTLLACISQLAAQPAPPAATLAIKGTTDVSSWSDGPLVAHVGQPAIVQLAEQPGHTVHWFQIFPDLDIAYQNANRAWEKNPYQWTGFDEIQYERVELTAWQGQWQVTVFTVDGRSALLPDPSRSVYHSTDLGSFWLAAEVRNAAGEIVARTPDLQESTSQGMSTDVFRLTRRQDDSFMGILLGYQNVPGLFGSVTRQSREYIGVDCADVQVSAYREMHRRYIQRNVNVAHLVDELPLKARMQIEGGQPDAALRWGEDIFPGDLLAVRYAGTRQFGHIGAAYRDTDGDGLLSPGDEILHAGPHPLKASWLSQGGLDGEVVLLRPK